jgi:hypothetical protein
LSFYYWSVCFDHTPLLPRTNAVCPLCFAIVACAAAFDIRVCSWSYIVRELLLYTRKLRCTVALTLASYISYDHFYEIKAICGHLYFRKYHKEKTSFFTHLIIKLKIWCSSTLKCFRCTIEFEFNHAIRVLVSIVANPFNLILQLLIAFD